MKIKINKEGFLKIKRGNVFKNQECPRTDSETHGMSSCGDWCPLFGEPVKQTMVTSLEICEKTFAEDNADFTDERA
jgi:hypothetical protein